MANGALRWQHGVLSDSGRVARLCQRLLKPQALAAPSKQSVAKRTRGRHVGPINFREAAKEAQDSAPVATQQDAMAPEDQPAHAAAPQGSFNWFKNWYPVAIAEDLDPLKPFATKLLGKDMVVWRDRDGEWRCFEDKCPHRLAPLSEGRIEPSDGTLQCSYHGWRYNGDGSAAAIPQARFDGEQVERTAIASKRSCVATYPTQVLLGMIWVWPESGPVAFIESAAAEPAVNQRVKDVDPGAVALTTNQNYVRDFTVAYDILYENISDQSHVPFAHHGVANNRTSPWAAHFVVSNVNKDQDGPDGYTYDLEWSPDAINPPINQNVRGVPPTYIEYFTPKADGAFTALWFHVVPLDEHTTRVFNHAVIVQPMHPALKTRLWRVDVQALAAARPRWIDHMLLNEIFDGDMAYLAKASQYAKERDPGGNTWAQDYYLPAGADRSAIAFRKWYHGRGGGGYVRAAGGTLTRPPQLTREQIMDRFHQHTAHCPSCSKALARARSGQQLAVAVATALVLLVAARLGGGTTPLSLATAGPLAAAAGALAFTRVLKLAERKLTLSDYDHAKH